MVRRQPQKYFSPQRHGDAEYAEFLRCDFVALGFSGVITVHD